MTEIPVLVVGAGPAGLTAAITLSRYEVPVLVVERRVDASTLARATGVSLRTMELVRSWGLEAAVRAGGVDVEWMMWFCATLARAAGGRGRPVGFPTRAQARVLSPTAPACVPQDHLEAVLLDHLRSQPGARVERGVEVEAITDGPDGATVALHEIDTGVRRTVRARFVVGADGIHSTVRSALGIAVSGRNHLHEGVTVQFRAPLWDVVGAHRYGIYWVEHPEAAGSMLPAGVGDRWVYGKPWDPARERLSDYTPERVTELLRLATGVPDLEPVVERAGATTFAAMIADTFRAGSVFLVGDAAHRVSPRGGTGMNTAVADAFDLGWKLGWVLRRWASPALLDTYETERRPIVEHNLERSADPDGSLREVADELPADLAGRLPHLWLPGRPHRTSTLDLLGPGLTVFTSADADAVSRVIDTAVPMSVHTLDPFTARALGIRGRDVLICRPDGVPAHGYRDAAGAQTLAARVT